MHVRKGDTIIVIAGNDKGTTGDVLSVDRDKKRVLVEGVNLRWHHVKPTEKTPKGERVQRECAIHASNVMHYDSAAKKRTRRRTGEDS